MTSLNLPLSLHEAKGQQTSHERPMQWRPVASKGPFNRSHIACERVFVLRANPKPAAVAVRLPDDTGMPLVLELDMDLAVTREETALFHVRHALR